MLAFNDVSFYCHKVRAANPLFTIVFNDNRHEDGAKRNPNEENERLCK